MSDQTLGAIAPLVPEPVERTGAQAGISAKEQIRIVLKTIIANGGSATMGAFYEAVNDAMAPYRLSSNGKSALRCYINRTGVNHGLVTATTVARQSAVWHSTAKGRALVQPVVPVIDIPLPAELRDPLIKVLGHAVGQVSGVFVNFEALLDDVLREAGFDPDDPPAGWNRSARAPDGRLLGVDRNICYAFRYAYRNCTPALTMKGPKAGLWGLTEHGVAVALGLLPRPLPKPRMLRTPLLQVMGMLSKHMAGAPIKQSAVFDAVMTAIGMDPTHLPSRWVEKGSNRQTKALDCVRSAVKSLRTQASPLLTQPARCQWALTPEGEKDARRLNGLPPRLVVVPSPKPPKPMVGPNTTAGWLGDHLTPARGQKESKLYGMMRSALCKRLPVSANAGMVEDHIQNFMLRVIRRDAFARMLNDGRTLPYSKVVAYCVNSGRTDARDMGTEPICREMFGARTEKERRERSNTVPQFGDNKGTSWDTDGNVIPPEDETVAIDDAANDFDVLWRQIENVVHDHKPQAWQRYSGILAMKARGFTTNEIARAEGVSRNRAASMLAEARRCVRESYAAGDLDGFVSMPMA